MTLIVALKSEHGVVLAGDKRNDYGNETLTYDDNATKIFEINSKVAIGGAGNGYDSKAIIDELLTYPDLQDMDVIQVKTLLIKSARSKQAEWFTPENEELIEKKQVLPPEFGFIIAGCTHEGQFKVYTFSSYNHSAQEEEKSSELGVTDIARYLISKQYKNTMTLAELKALVTSSIEETATISNAVSKTFDAVGFESSTPSAP
jgi:20S proteasome alpha/beta subunit